MDAKDLLLKEAANGFQVAAGGFNRLRDEVVINYRIISIKNSCYPSGQTTSSLTCLFTL